MRKVGCARRQDGPLSETVTICAITPYLSAASSIKLPHAVCSLGRSSCRRRCRRFPLWFEEKVFSSVKFRRMDFWLAQKVDSLTNSGGGPPLTTALLIYFTATLREVSFPHSHLTIGFKMTCLEFLFTLIRYNSVFC